MNKYYIDRQVLIDLIGEPNLCPEGLEFLDSLPGGGIVVNQRNAEEYLGGIRRALRGLGSVNHLLGLCHALGLVDALPLTYYTLLYRYNYENLSVRQMAREQAAYVKQGLDKLRARRLLCQ